MKIFLFIFFFLYLQLDTIAQAKPNIIIFLVDDMGWQDCSVPFYNEVTRQNKQFRTPNMERLAEQGMKFTHAYANQNCTPTRVSLMSGMNVIRHGVNNYVQTKNKSPEQSKVLETPDWNMNGISPVSGINNTVYASPLPMLLKKAGYNTIHVGKGHFGPGDTPGDNPLNLGFDINIAGGANGHPASYLGIDSFGNKAGRNNQFAVKGLEKYWGKDIFLTEALTLEALASLDSVSKNNKPFFLYFPHYAVHAPLMADKRFVQYYYNTGIDSTEAKYASLVEGMDKSLGDILNYLDKNNIANNTLIIFMSDNGGLTDVQRGKPLNQHNAPLRSGKTSGYEGGLRVPMIVRWPGKIQASSTNTNNVIIEDIFSTILTVAGIKNPDLVQKTDGVSLVKTFTNNTPLKERFITWHFPHGPNEGRSKDVVPFSAIRKGNWKLIYFHVDEHFELYNTSKDLGELNNIFTKEKKIATELAKELGKRLKENKVPMPVRKSDNKLISYPDDLIESVLK